MSELALNGYDISNWQSGLDVAYVPSDFVICKATEGTNYVDPTCDGFIQKCYNVGKLTGVYHFARTGSAKDQARFFVDNVRGYIGKTLLALDWENAEDYDTSVLSQGPGWAKEWLDEVHALTGVCPLIYMSMSVCREYDWSAVAGDYGLWVAQYPDYNATGYQSDPWTDGYGSGAFGSWAMHQYTSSGRLEGWFGDLDLNIFYGDAKAWELYVTGGGNAAVKGDVKKKSVTKLAKEVLAGKWGVGDDRRRMLTSEGYDYDAVQAKVNELVGMSNTKSVDQLAQEVIDGKWGDGSKRKKALTSAGYNYDAVQTKVNDMLGMQGAYDEVAKDVIAGHWGNGEDRRVKLENAGYDYGKVQARVNEML